ncbi:MAG: DUF2344 domain-containing protein [Clostridia bacterium]|nr:DUF2344 domain-containing protein [Clostridia bacterium]
MLVVRYTKTDGAEFISHLDTLRHLQKTIIRSGMKVGYSKGFNPHMLIFLSAPIGVGLTSTSEFFFIETDEDPKVFEDKFNAFCPGGFKAVWACKVRKNPNLQAIVDSAEYFILCDASDDTVRAVLGKKEYFVTDKRGVQKEVRNRIIDLKKVDNGLIARLSFGNDTLRADVFAYSIAKNFGVNVFDITKSDVFIKGVRAEEYIERNFASDK